MAETQVTERFRSTIAHLKAHVPRLTNALIAAELGVTPSYISHILSGKQKINIGVEHVDSLAKAFPEVSKAYILGLTDVGPLVKTELVTVPTQVETVQVPYVRATAFASFIAATDINTYPDSEIIHLPRYIANDPKARYVVYDVRGQSMEPNIKDGSQVLTKEVSLSDIKYINPGVYCVLYDDTFVIKRVKDNDLVTNGTLTLHSDNTETAGKFVVPHERIRGVWRVLKKLNEDVV